MADTAKIFEKINYFNTLSKKEQVDLYNITRPRNFYISNFIFKVEELNSLQLNEFQEYFSNKELALLFKYFDLEKPFFYIVKFGQVREGYVRVHFKSINAVQDCELFDLYKVAKFLVDEETR